MLTNTNGCVTRVRGCLGLWSVQGFSLRSFVQIILISSCLVHRKSFYGDTLFPSPTSCHPTSSIFMITCLCLMCFTCVLSSPLPQTIQPPRFLPPVPGHLVLFHSRIPSPCLPVEVRLFFVCVRVFVLGLFSSEVGSQIRRFPSAAPTVIWIKMLRAKFTSLMM